MCFDGPKLKRMREQQFEQARLLAEAKAQIDADARRHFENYVEPLQPDVEDAQWTEVCDEGETERGGVGRLLPPIAEDASVASRRSEEN